MRVISFVLRVPLGVGPFSTSAGAAADTNEACAPVRVVYIRELHTPHPLTLLNSLPHFGMRGEGVAGGRSWL